MLLLIAIILQIPMQSNDTASELALQSEVNDTAVTITETGVARQVEVNKKILCNDVEWHVKWKSNNRGTITDLKIVYIFSGKKINLRESALELRTKAQFLDSVSATCNPRKEGKPTRSIFMMGATDKKTGEYILAQLSIDDKTVEPEWTYSLRD